LHLPRTTGYFDYLAFFTLSFLPCADQGMGQYSCSEFFDLERFMPELQGADPVPVSTG